MYKVLLLALLLVSQTLASDSVLSQSGDLSAEIEVEGSNSADDLPITTSSFSGSLACSTYSTDGAVMVGLPAPPTKPDNWNFLEEHSLGDTSKWVSPGSDFVLRPIGYVATYTITFHTDCPQNGATLYFSATGKSYVQLNGQWVFSGGYPYPAKSHKVALKQPALKCGCNIIKIKVYNAWWASPVGLIYSLHQDNEGCYNCKNLGVTFYNKDTCQCECASGPSKCQNSLQQWFDYPNCGCMCSKSLLCTANKYFNRKSCTCECQPKCCPKGYVQDPDSCECRKQVYCLRVEICKEGYKWDQFLCQCIPKCPVFKQCPEGQKFNYDTCECECTSVALCASPLKWSPESCKCQCPYVARCQAPWTWNPQTCNCECQLFCIATMRLDQQNCRCVPLDYPIDPLPYPQPSPLPVIQEPVLYSTLQVSNGA